MQNEAAEAASGDAAVPAAGGVAAHAAVCENCATPLQGEYCHVCGQSAHNPLRHVGHALEEVFESFWHLDGRIFRTLRLLFVPGRVARDYLAGHRVRYIPPLRLFVILSLLTFFVGRLVLSFEPTIQLDGEPLDFRAARTVAEVEQRRDRLLATLRQKEQEAAKTPGADAGLIAARARIDGAAADRIADLRRQARPDAAADGAAKTGEAETVGAATPAKKVPENATAAAAPPGATPAGGEARVAEDDAGSDPACGKFRSSPQDRAWLPHFADRWINARVVRACENLDHADTEGGRLFQAGLAALPSALFMLMPVFALLLKLVYLGSGRGYLEHLVAALYSHAFLLLMLLVLFLLSASGNIGVPGWLRGLGYTAVWIGTPVYLWKMQRRVYGGGWLSNLVRYAVIGCTYFVLVSLATAYAVLIGISS